MKLRVVILALTLGAGSTFTPFAPIHSRALDRVLVQQQASYLSEIEDPEENRRQGPAWKRLQEEKEGRRQEGTVDPQDYNGFVDAEGFDGGDGQVGVVGDGSNAMEQFDQSGTVNSDAARTRTRGEMVGGSESKKTRANVFGYTTGYSDKLKDQGLVDIDQYGEDRMYARRQQLENWRNQRELRQQQDASLESLADMAGMKYDRRQSTKAYMEALNAGTFMDEDEAKWNIYQGDSKREEAQEAATGLTMGDITETFEMSCSFPRPAFLEIHVHNDVMSYEDFVVGFTPDSDVGDFSVSPLSGQLNRRGGEPVTLSLTFNPAKPGGTRNLFMIVETEESKFTYRIIGHVQ